MARRPTDGHAIRESRIPTPVPHAADDDRPSIDDIQIVNIQSPHCLHNMIAVVGRGSSLSFQTAWRRHTSATPRARDHNPVMESAAPVDGARVLSRRNVSSSRSWPDGHRHQRQYSIVCQHEQRGPRPALVAAKEAAESSAASCGRSQVPGDSSLAAVPPGTAGSVFILFTLFGRWRDRSGAFRS